MLIKLNKWIDTVNYVEWIFTSGSNYVFKNGHNIEEIRRNAREVLVSLGFTIKEIEQWEVDKKLYRSGKKQPPEKILKILERDFDFRIQ